MSTPRPAEQRRLLLWWLTSASILLVVVAVLAGYWIFTTVHSFAIEHRSSGCLPSDFPTYSNIVVQEVDQSFAVPDSIALCRMRMTSRDDFESVNDFYHVQLNVNDWKITNYAENFGDSTITFERRSHHATSGVMSIDKTPRTTDIQVQLSG